jgi:hypothetical protein
MYTNEEPMKPLDCPRLAVATMLAMGALCPPQAFAQLPARFYLDTLSGSNAVPLIYESMSGNTNPFDPAHTVTAGANFDATLTLAGYVRTFSLFDRAAMAAILEPMGRVSSDVTVGLGTVQQSAKGFGDPMLEFTLNVVGPKAQKNIPDVLRYEPGFSVDLLFDLTLPIGEYDSSQLLNIGQNRWYGRVGAPIIWQLGPWVPSRRTTLEFLPAVWLYGDNDDFVGQTLETDPKYQLDAHLTRDFTDRMWGSLDFTAYSGGRATIDGVQGEKLDIRGMGFTFGYVINSNANLTFGYKSTLNDDEPEDLSMDVFMVSFVFGWHPMIEGFRRLESE